MIIVKYLIKCDTCGAHHSRLCDSKEDAQKRAKRIWISTKDGKHFCSPYCQARYEEKKNG